MRPVRALLLSVVFPLLLAGSARAQTPSVMGGKLLPSNVSGHHFGVGIPSFFYEWWNATDNFDWALHVGIVYDDWSAEYSDVDVGLDLEVPMRFLLAHRGSADVAFKFAPGVLIGDHDHGRNVRDDDLILGLRPELGVLVSVEMSSRVNLVTGGVVPVTVLIHDHGNGNDVVILVPVLPRIGIEVQTLESLIPWFLLELGPTIGMSSDDTDAKLGARAWLGLTWYP